MHGRRILTFLLPGLFIWLAAEALVRWEVVARWFPAAGQTYPCLVYLAGLLLGWRFNRGGVVFAVTALAVTDRLLAAFSPSSGAAQASADACRNAVAVLLPLTFTVVALQRERGILSLHGLCRFAAILVQMPLVELLARYPHLALNRWLAVPLPGLEWLAPCGPTAVAAVAFLLAAITVALAFFGRRSTIESAMLWALLCAYGAVRTHLAAPAQGVYLGAGALVLAAAVVDVSFGMAFRDELTGLPGRRALMETLSRRRGPFALAMADVDHFKRINDRYGHDVGDQVLRMVAAQLSKVLLGGKVHRYGGEEFAVVFPGRTAEEALTAMDAVRRELESLQFVIRSRSRPKRRPSQPLAPAQPSRTFAVTISAGVAEADAEALDHWPVVRSADAALYRAKRAGRNRVFLASRRREAGGAGTPSCGTPAQE